MRRAFPRSRARHELAAGELLDAYARRFAWAPGLPVPVEHIVEAHVGLTIEWAELEEPGDARVLGALIPSRRTIVLNERHEEMYERWMGPYEFTLAHELGHWVYDAVPPSQGTLLDAAGAAQTVFCRARTDVGAIREVNANRFAACLLLPESLLRREVTGPFSSSAAFGERARTWHVSSTTLGIRMVELKLGGFLP